MFDLHGFLSGSFGSQSISPTGEPARDGQVSSRRRNLGILPVAVFKFHFLTMYLRCIRKKTLLQHGCTGRRGGGGSRVSPLLQEIVLFAMFKDWENPR